MFFRDQDGQVALDFLGEAVLSNLEPDLARNLATGAWRYTQSALNDSRNGSNSRILEKYEWLAAYMRPRLLAWGVTP